VTHLVKIPIPPKDVISGRSHMTVVANQCAASHYNVFWVVYLLRFLFRGRGLINKRPLYIYEWLILSKVNTKWLKNFCTPFHLQNYNTFAQKKIVMFKVDFGKILPYIRYNLILEVGPPNQSSGFKGVRSIDLAYYPIIDCRIKSKPFLNHKQHFFINYKKPAWMKKIT